MLELVTILKESLKPKRPRTKEQSKKKISESKKGKPTWNKGIQLKKFVCDICGKEVGGIGNLLQHINKHNMNTII